MSGHSKWSKVKHQKEATDAVKGKVFTKMANAIIIAVKTGGGDDPNSNFKLRLAIDKAKEANMPKENISRAIERAAKSGSGEEMSEILYEAFGPSGAGLLIKSATDNRQRTVAEIKNILDRAGGTLAGSGAVSHMFDQVGIVEVSVNPSDKEKLIEKVIDTGIVDYEEAGDRLLLYTLHNDLHRVREALEKQGISVLASELYFKPTTTIEIKNENEAEKINGLIHALEEREDVQKVYSNILTEHV